MDTNLTVKDILQVMYPDQMVKIRQGSFDKECGKARTLLNESEYLNNKIKEMYICAIDKQYIGIEIY